MFFLIAMCVDLIILYRFKNGFTAKRIISDKLSNSDDNEVLITLENNYPFQVFINLIDELPAQFKKRDFDYKTSLQSAEKSTFAYNVRPVERGEYNFGNVHVFVSSILQIFSRRYSFSDDKNVRVYPSYVQMKKYEFLAMHNNLTEFGMKKIRRIGHTMEFEQIKNYIPGDDVRNVNWKANC